MDGASDTVGVVFDEGYALVTSVFATLVRVWATCNVSRPKITGVGWSYSNYVLANT